MLFSSLFSIGWVKTKEPGSAEGWRPGSSLCREQSRLREELRTIPYTRKEPWCKKWDPVGAPSDTSRQDTPSEETTRSDCQAGPWFMVHHQPVMSLEGERGMSVSRPPGPGVVEQGLLLRLPRRSSSHRRSTRSQETDGSARDPTLSRLYATAATAEQAAGCCSPARASKSPPASAPGSA